MPGAEQQRNSLTAFAHTKMDFRQSPEMRPTTVGNESSVHRICVQPGLDGGGSTMHNTTLTFLLPDEAR